jgi:hypothetical protein
MSFRARKASRAALVAALLLVIAGAVWSRGDAAPGGTVASSGTNDTVAASHGLVPRSRASCVGSPRDPGGPDPWGGCWPGPRNTGVPAGTTLTPISGDRIIEKDGAVVSGLDVAGCITVGALNVTIENSRARCVTLVSGSRARYCHAAEGDAIRELTGCTVVAGLSDNRDPRTNNPRLTIRNSEIDCRAEPGRTGTGIGDRNMRVIRVDIHNCENGYDADSYMKIKNNYIHDLYNTGEGDPHTDGIQSGVVNNLLLVHNLIYGFSTGCDYPSGSANCNGTSAMILGGQPDVATAGNTTVRRNLMAGGAYTLYCPILTPKGFSIIENRFSEVYSPKVGEYGPMDGCRGPGITRQGNKRIRY